MSHFNHKMYSLFVSLLTKLNFIPKQLFPKLFGNLKIIMYVLCITLAMQRETIMQSFCFRDTVNNYTKNDSKPCVTSREHRNLRIPSMKEHYITFEIKWLWLLFDLYTRILGTVNAVVRSSSYPVVLSLIVQWAWYRLNKVVGTWLMYHRQCVH